VVRKALFVVASQPDNLCVWGGGPDLGTKRCGPVDGLLRGLLISRGNTVLTEFRQVQVVTQQDHHIGFGFLGYLKG
jgi:hypothetical protein